MLGTPPQDKLHKVLHIFNACGHSWIMMIMVGSKMSKTEYDLKAIMYPAYDTPHKLRSGTVVYCDFSFICQSNAHTKIGVEIWITNICSLSQDSVVYNFTHSTSLLPPKSADEANKLMRTSMERDTLRVHGYWILKWNNMIKLVSSHSVRS